MRDSLPALVLMTDYAARAPLWQAGGCLVDLGHLELDPDLVRDLLEWQRYFDEHFGIERWPNWDTADDESWYESQGRALHARLDQALPDRTVTLDLWPVEGVAPGT